MSFDMRSATLQEGAADEGSAGSTMEPHEERALLAGAAIRKLWPVDRDLFREHLLRLDRGSRRLRFGGAVSDQFIRQYADRAMQPDCVIYGCFLGGVLRAASELRPLADPQEAEAAFSVEQAFQNAGLGTELMSRTIIAARNRGIKKLYMICLRDNVHMQALAAKHEAQLKFAQDEVTGTLDPAFPTPYSVMAEAIGDAQGFVAAVFDWRR
jgi:RimJ/RimL family protein N-acetyltransferase